MILLIEIKRILSEKTGTLNVAISLYLRWETVNKGRMYEETVNVVAIFYLL